MTVFHLKVLKLKVLKLKVLKAKGIDVLKVLNAKGIDAKNRFDLTKTANSPIKMSI